DEIATVVPESSSIAFGVEGGSETIAIATNQVEWSYRVTGGEGWLTVDKNGNSLQFQALENTLTTSRDATILVSAGVGENMATALLSVTQEGATAATLTLDPNHKEVESKETTFTVTITTNKSEWGFTLLGAASAWISAEKSGNSLIVTIAENSGSEREGAIQIVAGVTGNQITKVFDIVQAEKSGGGGGGELNIETLF
ncbi:MAG: BACON domain-containing carbohydrate-binding protein, partial [Bacteroidales bacterium]